MSFVEHPEYFVDVAQEGHVFSEFDSAKRMILKELQANDVRLSLSANDGTRPWWHRLLGASIWVRLYFSVEWHGPVAQLIFHDENGSEWRVVNDKLEIEEGSLKQHLSHFEEPNSALEPSFLMTVERARAALTHFIEKGVKPDWLTYEFVE